MSTGSPRMGEFSLFNFWQKKENHEYKHIHHNHLHTREEQKQSNEYTQLNTASKLTIGFNLCLSDGVKKTLETTEIFILLQVTQSTVCVRHKVPKLFHYHLYFIFYTQQWRVCMIIVFI